MEFSMADSAVLEESDEKAELKSVEIVTKNSLKKRKFRTEAAASYAPMEAGENKDYDLRGEDKTTSGSTTEIKARKNLNETAFFYPHLQTNPEGDIVISFTVPEALTKWKFLGLAHTKDLSSGVIVKETVTQKDLMVGPNAPRFFRENDEIEFTAKVTNLSHKDLTGSSSLLLFDAVSARPVDSLFNNSIKPQKIEIKRGRSALVTWKIKVPESLGAVTFRVLAQAGNHTDGEENSVPVLTNRMLVTESMPLTVRSKQIKDFVFEKLSHVASTTLKHHMLTLEFTANPAWYAVQSLPYLMEYPYECSEQIFSRFYANSIASHITQSNRKIKAVFDRWSAYEPNALLSNLEKNQELKSALLEETPWVLEAKDESERKKRVALLFDLNKMSFELQKSLEKLKKMQTPNGGWPWFEGMRDDEYITQYIVTGLGRLGALGINVRGDEEVNKMLIKAVRYTDDRIREEYEYLKKNFPKQLDQNNLSYSAIQYLYARSYFKNEKIQPRNQKAFDYYKSQAQKFWLSQSRYMQGMISLALHRFEDKKTPTAILKSVKEHAIVNEEMGMYWKENYSGFYWYESPIEAQALMIEAFDEILKDQKSVDELRVWLLKSKQTQNWPTTRSTAEACYALLLRGSEWISTSPAVEISIGEKNIDLVNDPEIRKESGTGYFKKTWAGSEISSSMAKVKVSKKDEGVSWGSVYWQYFEQLDKITPAKTPLTINKKLFVKTGAKSITAIDQNSTLAPGDRIVVRIELIVDRDMEYIHMKDMRASGFEPVDVLSNYRYQDGLGYYQSTRDAATNFFFDRIRKGTYVFEYELNVTHRGNFSNGITTVQCMYAPEFTSHSEGIRVNIK